MDNVKKFWFEFGTRIKKPVIEGGQYLGLLDSRLSSSLTNIESRLGAVHNFANIRMNLVKSGMEDLIDAGEVMTDEAGKAYGKGPYFDILGGWETALGEKGGLKGAAEIGQVKELTDKQLANMTKTGLQGKGMIPVGFQYQWLGIMFAGMALKKTFDKLVQPAMQLFGVFDLLNNVLVVLFVPFMVMMMPYFIQFAKFLIELSPFAKMILAWVTVFIFIGGTLLLILGQAELAFNSLLMILGAPLAAAFSAFLIAIVMLTVAIAALVSWMDYLLRMKEQGINTPVKTDLLGGMGVGSLFAGPMGLIPGAVAGGMMHMAGYARGGIVTSPTLALLGESGPEAVVPLGAGGSYFGNFNINANMASTLDVDILAKRIFNMMNDNQQYKRGY